MLALCTLTISSTLEKCHGHGVVLAVSAVVVVVVVVEFAHAVEVQAPALGPVLQGAEAERVATLRCPIYLNGNYNLKWFICVLCTKSGTGKL